MGNIAIDGRKKGEVTIKFHDDRKPSIPGWAGSVGEYAGKSLFKVYEDEDFLMVNYTDDRMRAMFMLIDGKEKIAEFKKEVRWVKEVDMHAPRT